MKLNSYSYFVISVLSCILYSCNNGTELEKNKIGESTNDSLKLNLAFLFPLDTLKLCTVDTKCGEWGGDTKSINIYDIGNYNQSTILFDIRETEMNCDSVLPENLPTIKFQKSKIIASQHLKKLLNEAIEELLQLKLSSSSIVGNSGSISSLNTKESGIKIWLYGSPEWKKFNQLFSELKKLPNH